MKLLFVHGFKIKEDANGTYYTDGSYGQAVWDRYLSIASELSVVARKELFIYDPEEAKAKFNNFNKEKIHLIEVPDLNKSLKKFLNMKLRKERKDTIRKAVKESDLVIARLRVTLAI